MKSIEFMIWLRDEMDLIHHSKEGDCLKPPSNGELRRWIKNGALKVNGCIVTLTDTIEWPITELVLFPKNPQARCTIV